jgi:hypothetical protein
MTKVVTAAKHMTDNEAAGSFATQRRRESRREEWSEQTKLARLLTKYFDPTCTFWTSLENKPLSQLSGTFQKRRGVRSGLPDVLVIFCQKPIFVELKSRAGIATKSAAAATFGNAAGRRRVVHGAKRACRADGAASVGRCVPAQMEAAAAQALGGTVRRPDAAAAASAGRSGAATGRTTTMASA